MGIRGNVDYKEHKDGPTIDMGTFNNKNDSASLFNPDEDNQTGDTVVTNDGVNVGGGDTAGNAGYTGAGDTGTGDTGTGDTGVGDSGGTSGRTRSYTGKEIDIGPGTVPSAGDGPDPFTSSGTGNDPTATKWDVTKEQTVAGQLEDNYDKGSPFMEKAAEEAQRKHLASGGQNSLMAQKMGHMAAMDTAFKVSFADAATYARSAEFNAAMQNQFGLAEQRFIQNSLLSDQNYKQSVELQTQMIAGQLEGIRQEYRGKSQLIDREFEQFFSKATYEAQLKEFAEQSGYQRAVSLYALQSKGNFLTGGFEAVMNYANREGFTPEQSAAAVASGMRFLREGFDVNESFWASVGAGPDRGGDFPDAPYGADYEWWNFEEYSTGG